MANQPGQKFLRILKWWPHWNGHVWCATFQQKLHWLSISLLKCREFFENHDAKCHGHTTDLFSELVATETFPKIYSTRDLVIFNVNMSPFTTVTCHRLLRRLVRPRGNVQRDLRWHQLLHEWNAKVCRNIKKPHLVFRLGARFVCSNFLHLLHTFAAYFLNTGSLDYWLGTTPNLHVSTVAGLARLEEVQAVVKQSWISMMDEFASWVENARGQPSSFNSCTICLLARGH